MKRTFGWLWLAVLVVPLGASHSKGQDAGNVTPDLVYEVGTDSGMRYLAQHAPALRVTLLLLECELPSLARITGSSLPNSVEWFVSGDDAPRLPPTAVPFAAQVTRAYLLGYEAGVRTEFDRMPQEEKETTCSAAALAASDFRPGQK